MKTRIEQQKSISTTKKEGVKGSISEKRDLIGWNASLAITFLALAVWGALASTLVETVWSFWVGVFFLGAGLFRGFFTAFTVRRPALLWSAFGAFIFILVGIGQMLTPPSLELTIFLVSFAILIDVAVGAYLAKKYVDSNIRRWILILGPIHLFPGLLILFYSSVSNRPLFLSFISVLALSVHSVAAFSVFLHMKKKLADKPSL